MSTNQSSAVNQINTPQIKLPTGGGTVRGADENFHADAFTGAASFGFPISVPAARGLSPGVSVGYSSGSGNGLLGAGFSLSESSISIKSNRALPKYDGNDIYLWNESTELVERKEANGEYLERHQTSFALIQKRGEGENTYWEITHNDHSKTIYGETPESKIADPEDNSRIFKWLINSQVDPHGNKILYFYDKLDNSRNNTYLSKIAYGNYFKDGFEHFAFEIHFDYGQIDLEALLTTSAIKVKSKFDKRKDCITSHRAGFSVGMDYLLQNVFILHHFEELGDKPCLTHRTAFQYTENAVMSTLKTITAYGYQRNKMGDAYEQKSLPPIELSFLAFKEGERNLTFEPLCFEGDDAVNLPLNLPLNLLDFERNGLPGLLYRNAETLYFHPSTGDGQFDRANSNAPLLHAPNQFADPRQALNMVSLEGDGALQLEMEAYQSSGYYPLNEKGGWETFVPFPKEYLNHLPFHTEHVDLTGDNRPDQVVITPEKIICRPSLGLAGMSDAVYEVENEQQVEAENGRIKDPFIFYGFADMFGDGLSHRIKVEDQKISIWPSLGYGKFGQKSSVSIPDFKIVEEQLDLHKRLILADVNGSGKTDLVLCYPDKIKVFYNQNGVSFSAPQTFTFGNGLSWSEFDHIQFADILGNGNTCLLLSKLSPHSFSNHKGASQFLDIAHYYVEIKNEDIAQSYGKAFMLQAIDNNMGVKTEIFYKSSLKDYLAAKKEGNPWTTRLPFPVIVLDKTRVTDFISNSVMTSAFTYRNGYYNPLEHTFAGFGCVTHLDLPQELNDVFTSPPIVTKQWFHLGSGSNYEDTIREFYQGDQQAPRLPFQIIAEKYQANPEALMALVGSELHHEVYDKEAFDKGLCPYETGSASFEVICTQEPMKGQKGVFRVHSNESIALNYEQRQADPHVSHSFVLETDEMNHPLLVASVAYPRRKALIEEQKNLYCSGSETFLKNQTEKGLPRMVGIALESRSFEITGLTAPKNRYYSFDELKSQVVANNTFVNPIDYSATPDAHLVQARLLSWQKQHYWNNEQQTSVWNPNDPIPAILLPHHSESVVFDQTNLKDILEGKINHEECLAAGYFFEAPYYWAKTAVAHYLKTPESFYLLAQMRNDWVDKSSYRYTESSVVYDPYNLLPLSSSVRLNDDIRLSTSALMDYRTLSPWQVIDPNGNMAEVLTDVLGVVVASAVFGKNKEGDSPISEFTHRTPESIADVFADPLKYIQNAANYFHYEFPYFDKAKNAWQPALSISLARTVYQSENPNDIQRGIAYNDGFGRVIESKHYVGDSPERKGKGNWLASGRMLYDGKGQVAKSYLGYFSDTWAHQVDWDAAIKDSLPVPSTFEYDALGRQIQVNSPKGFCSKVLILNAWESQHFDESDTILESPYYQSGKWQNDPAEKEAIEKAVLFYNTPSATTMDTLGRQIIAVSNNRVGQNPPIDWTKTALTPEDIDPKDANLLVSWQSFDIQGRVLLQADARFHEANQTAVEEERKYNFIHHYPMAGGMARSISTDAGTGSGFSDALGNNLRSWDARGIEHGGTYDNLQRPLTQHAILPDGEKQVLAVTVYGETMPDAAEQNMLGKAWKSYDSAGLAIIPGYSFDGHLLNQEFRYRKDFMTEADWNPKNLAQAEDLLEAEIFYGQGSFDAAGRPLTQTLPDRSVSTWEYGIMGNCTRSTVTVQGKLQEIVTGSHLDAQGHLTQVAYANGVKTNFQYDPLSLQIIAIQAKRSGDDEAFQDLAYTHDPTGLITRIHNQARETQYFNNQQVQPVVSYTYDALYRLVKAGGSTQVAKGNPHLTAKNQGKMGHLAIVQADDLKAIENYSETYGYDKGNNLLWMQRKGGADFTRSYSIDERSNRVLAYDKGKDTTKIEYDTAGQMLLLNGNGTLPLEWNIQGNIAKTTLLKRQNGPDDAEYYVYSAGLRVRKVKVCYDKDGKELSRDDKRYLGNYRRTNRSASAEVRHSITLGGVQKHDCVLQYSTDTSKNLLPDTRIFRFQHADHLNSVGLETNLEAQIISYEEYSPFGETTYSLSLSNLDSSKEYRYSAQEKDDTTGLYYYGFRYYAPWLCRWTRPDPAGTIDGFNLYAFVGNEPVGRVDLMGLEKKAIEKKKTLSYKTIKGIDGFKDYKSLEVFRKSDDSLKEIEKQTGCGKEKISKFLKDKYNERFEKAAKKSKYGKALTIAKKQAKERVVGKTILKIGENLLKNRSNKNLFSRVLEHDVDEDQKGRTYIILQNKEQSSYEGMLNVKNHPAKDYDSNAPHKALLALEMERNNFAFALDVTLKKRRMERAKVAKDNSKIDKLVADFNDSNRLATFEIKGVSGQDRSKYENLVAENMIRQIDELSSIDSIKSELIAFKEAGFQFQNMTTQDAIDKITNRVKSTHDMFTMDIKIEFSHETNVSGDSNKVTNHFKVK